MRLYTDIAVSVIPTVTLPLTPHVCMCQSMETVANNFHIQIPAGLPIPPVTYNCTPGEQCNTVVCVINNNSEQPITLMFDPCTEIIRVFTGKILTESNEVAEFNQTEDRIFTLESSPSLTAHMVLSNGNYSMNFSVCCHINLCPCILVSYVCTFILFFKISFQTSVSAYGIKTELFQPTQVLLDRSSCDSDIVYYYPGSSPSPPSDCSSSINLPSGCQLLNNCSGFMCSSPPFASALVVVDKCSDPLKVDISISSRDSSNNLLKTSLFVNGPDVVNYKMKDFTIQISRNSTHFSISVSCVFSQISIPGIVHEVLTYLCT